MTTMTEEPEAAVAQSDGTDELQQGMARAKILMQECVKFRLTVSEFSPSKGFDAATKEEIAAVTGMNKSAVSGGKKLYDPNCDPIKNARSALQAAKSLVDGMTIPLEHFKGSGKDAGYRLLEVEKADMLQEQLEGHRANIKAAEDRLNTERDTILEASEKLLGRKFDQGDYPERFKLEIDWHVEPALLPQYMATIMPKTFERAMAKAEQVFENTAQTAVEEFMEEFLCVVHSWSDRLGPKTKIYPPANHELARFSGAEILERQTHAQDPENVPPNQLRLKIGYKPRGARKREEFLLGPMTQQEYAALHPDVDAADKKTFKNSTIQNLVDVVHKFRNIGSMLSAPSGFNAVVDRISQHLADMGNADDVADELRNSRSYRASTVSLMDELAEKLDAEIVEVRQKRRKISRIQG